MNAQSSIRTKFKKLWPYYIFQSLLASAALCVIILILPKDKMVVISTIGATSFIVFALPNTVSAKSRNVIGDHQVGLACGAVFSLIFVII